MPTLPERRKRELDLKLKSLENELSDWADRTQVEPMRRHSSQVRRITGTLNGLLDSMKQSPGWRAPTDETILAKAASWEKRILTAHAIWEVFRSKFMQRKDELFQDRLAACDDLAWACYEPAMRRYSTTPKEPPLVYLNSTWSAFLRRRDVAFDKDVELGKDTRDALEQEDYKTTLSKLPIPLLGLPWFQVAHLPSALIIAHEVGHAVEFDFDLTSQIDTALRNAGLQFAADWRYAASEVFADLYGCLCLGRHFAAALLDLMVADKAVVDAERTFGRYPTRAFRVELALSALRYLEQDENRAPAGAPSTEFDDSREIRTTWELVYGSVQQLVEYRPDVEKVVNAIYGKDGMNLSALIQRPAASIPALAQHAAQGDKTEIANHNDARVLFCALWQVYDSASPGEFARAADLLVTQVVRGYAATSRGRGVARIAAPDRADVRGQDPAAADVAIGKALEQLLGFDRD